MNRKVPTITMAMTTVNSVDSAWLAQFSVMRFCTPRPQFSKKQGYDPKPEPDHLSGSEVLVGVYNDTGYMKVDTSDCCLEDELFISKDPGFVSWCQIAIMDSRRTSIKSLSKFDVPIFRGGYCDGKVTLNEDGEAYWKETGPTLHRWVMDNFYYCFPVSCPQSNTVTTGDLYRLLQEWKETMTPHGVFFNPKTLEEYYPEQWKQLSHYIFYKEKLAEARS